MTAFAQACRVSLVAPVRLEDWNRLNRTFEAAGRILRAALFGVTPLDAPSLAGATAVFLAVTLLAAATPGRRAARVGAIEAIRGE